MRIVLDWREWLEDVRIRRFEDDVSLAQIKNWTEHLPSNRTAFIFDTAHPLQEEIESAWIIRGFTTQAKLAEIYNAMVSEKDRVKSFHDRDTAFRRIALKLIDKAQAAVPSIIPQTQRTKSMEGENTEVTGTEVKAKKTRAPKAEKAPAEPKAPGVISTLVDMLKNGGGTVEELYQHLASVFPDRAGEGSKGGMGTTIRVQLVRLAKTGKLNIHKEKVEGRGLVYTGSAVE
jgi:hypothetical protein